VYQLLFVDINFSNELIGVKEFQDVEMVVGSGAVNGVHPLLKSVHMKQSITVGYNSGYIGA